MRRAGLALLAIASGVLIGFFLANRWSVRGQGRPVLLRVGQYFFGSLPPQFQFLLGSQGQRLPPVPGAFTRPAAQLDAEEHVDGIGERTPSSRSNHSPVAATSRRTAGPSTLCVAVRGSSSMNCT